MCRRIYICYIRVEFVEGIDLFVSLMTTRFLMNPDSFTYVNKGEFSTVIKRSKEEDSELVGWSTVWYNILYAYINDI